MRTRFLFLLPILFFCISVVAQDEMEEQADTVLTEEQFTILLDSLDASMNYETGTVDISDGLAVLNVPDNYKFLNPEQSAYILTEIWGNPPAETLGMLFVKKESPFGLNEFSYAVEITYSEEGYIEDEDAQDLDYDDLIEEMKSDATEINKIRKEEGYPEVELVGWASPPFYDEKNKKLHWAKELKFGTEEVNTLNYNIRVLGRKGYLNLNVIGEINQLSKVQGNVEAILASIEFTDGNKYSDFNPEIDKIAAYGIGGLIAGKVLAKAGFFALLVKFWKVIPVGAVALIAGIRKFLKGKNQETGNQA